MGNRVERIPHRSACTDRATASYPHISTKSSTISHRINMANLKPKETVIQEN